MFRRLQRLTLPVVAIMVVAAGSLTTAQKPYPIFTLDDYVSAMKGVGRAFGVVTLSLAKNDFETAKSQLVLARQRLAVTITFWRDHKKDDALKMLRDTLTKMDDLDAVLSAEKVDAAAASDLLKQVNAGCQSCHLVYRDQDPTTKAFRLKPGSVQ